MTTVACDVCGERYEVARSAFGRSQKCKMCLVAFDVCSHTVAPEVDEAQADDEPGPSEFAVVQRAVGTGLTTLALIGCFAWMASLPFRNPREVSERVAVAAHTVTPVPGRTPAIPEPRVITLPAVTTPIPQSPSSPAEPLPGVSRFSNPAVTAAEGSTANTTTDSITPGPLPGDVPPNSLPSQTGEPLKLRIGLIVQVRQDNLVRRATVLRVLSDGMVQVRYLDHREGTPQVDAVKAEQIERSPGDTPPNVSPSTAATNRPVATGPVGGGQHNYNGPGSIPSSGRKVDSAAQLRVQQIVQVQWGNAWYPADVVRINSNGTVRIHYRGWSNGSDEDITLSRVQLAHGAVAPSAKATPATATANQPDTSITTPEGGQPNYEGPGKVPSSGRRVPSLAPLKQGLIVQVVWGGSGRWFPADVVRINANKTVRIHFRGWSDSFDEDVTLDKIQLAHDGINRK